MKRLQNRTVTIGNGDEEIKTRKTLFLKNSFCQLIVTQTTTSDTKYVAPNSLSLCLCVE